MLETLDYAGNLVTSRTEPPAMMDDHGRLIAQGEHLMDNTPDRGWLADIAAVLPIPGYAPSRPSPISATEVMPGHCRFLLRHGPVKAGLKEVILKLSFGDGNTWISSTQPWSPSQSPEGDAWDRYQTVIDHKYAKAGRYEVRMSLHHNLDGYWEAFREAFGYVYIGIPAPNEAPVALRWGIAAYTVDDASPGSGTGTLGFELNRHIAGESAHTEIPVPRDRVTDRLVVSKIGVSTVRADSTCVTFAVVPPPVQGTTSYTAFVDVGDGFPPYEMNRRDYEQGTVFGTAHEYLRPGIYHVTVTGVDRKSNSALFTLERQLHVSADRPPHITDGAPANTSQ
jgi:hypothetical protein